MSFTVAANYLRESNLVLFSVWLLQRYLFQHYPEIGSRLFSYFSSSSSENPALSHVISVANFKKQTEKLLSIMSDDQLVQMYVTVCIEFIFDASP